jgi:drug/metabolite transporter (DMT)-like permease
LRTGLWLAVSASAVSGLAVFLNSYALKHVRATPTTYTMAKNLVAAFILGSVLVLGTGRTLRPDIVRPRTSAATKAALAYVGLVGGGLAFALFFEGLSTSSATTAAFVQKSLVVWVIALAVPLLGEKVGPVQWSSVALLVAGATALGAAKGGFRFGEGPALILAATLLWAVEVVIVKHLLTSIPPLTVGLTRMGVGTAALAVWLAVTGRLSQLENLGRSGWAWVILTGALLAVYVAVWFTALAHARAVDVTAVLVSAAFITALLSAGVQGASLPHPWGLGLVAAGTVLVVGRWQFVGRSPSEVPRS